MRLYSKRETEAARLRLARTMAESPRPPEGPKRHRRQRQHRLSMTEVTELIKDYERQMPIKELARRFGIHRLTVTAHLRRQGVELRLTGLAPEDVLTAARLYRQGWSLMKLGAKYGVDSTTVWRALRGAGVVMRPSSSGS